jgi:phosphatidylserine/phosphatidylglycerophosphate/cardiolipin synthase-like enzyme
MRASPCQNFLCHILRRSSNAVNLGSMRRTRLIAYSVRSVALAALLGLVIHIPAAVAAEVTVCFAPPLPDGCDPTSVIIQTLGAAQHRILVQAYQFTSTPIANAIVEAHARGIDVRVILDKSNEKRGYSKLKFLQDAGIPVMIDSSSKIAHNKIMIVDSETVITGSFNFTKSAQAQNAENLVVIRDAHIATEYIQNWKEHLAQSQAPGPAAAAGEPVEPKPPLGPFVGDIRTGKFFWPACESFNKIAPANRVPFATWQAAESAGYKAAKNCPNYSLTGNFPQ